ncbi:MAG: UbiD family decarboxylase [Rickettsiaceae bacterium]|jgi:4-hydroxy-3-polyprenylbenzoate decarboxylase|uniref:UbiD family decarboxylase n=1 Tax=Candidatus Megaera polyxenophila TaxID=988779 RepID=UPI001B5850CE|nr:UbiD family decarboxylase [Rickettsiaceae bacterium]WHA06028.1 UbiD family decarboxylase [Candidatus Megaera polyxenophila]BBB57183.1 3-polyprenyl-4-hydroxybenzoate decarboxylase [Candidatus Megaera polyxenophila]
MIFKDLPAFLEYLEKNNHLKRIKEVVSTQLEVTEISKRFLHNNGPALLFENVIKEDGKKSKFPIVTNLYAHPQRISWALGLNSQSELRQFGKLLAFLKNPEPPSSIKETFSMLPIAKRILSMSPKNVKKAVCQEVVILEPDLNILPIQKCWPLDVSPLITWPLIITKGTGSDKTDSYNLGVYRLQVVGKDKLIMRWLKMRGGAAHHTKWQNLKEPMPAAAVIGANPTLTLAAVMPIPNTMSEYNFAGLLQSSSIELVQCKTIDLKVPANAEIILEGYVSLDEYLPEGPFGDHTGYYNDVELFPVFKIKAITMRKNPVYLSTYTGKPPDEPSVLGEALNEIFIPLIQNQFPEIVDFWLPPEGCSYRIGVISIRKTYPGQAKRIMMGIWSFLQQFMYTKYIIIVDDDIDVRNWSEVMWAVATRTDAKRDFTFIENSPIDYLDFASPMSGLGSKLGIDATNKITPETSRQWGEKIKMNDEIIKKVDKIWPFL